MTIPSGLKDRPLSSRTATTRPSTFAGPPLLPLWIVHLRPDSHDKIFRIAWVRRVGDRLVGKAAVKWYKMETWQGIFLCDILCRLMVFMHLQNDANDD